MLALIQEHINLINEILRTNRTATDLAQACKLGQNNKGSYTLDNRLLKYQGRLVVLESVRTDLIIASYCSLAIAYLGKSKTRELVKTRYYWLGIDCDIDRFVSNCYACRRLKVPRDKALGLLRLLLIPDCL
jgi:hypothetical protein